MNNCIWTFSSPFSLNIPIRRFPIKVYTHISGNYAVYLHDISLVTLYIIADGILIGVIIRPLNKALLPLELSPHANHVITHVTIFQLCYFKRIHIHPAFQILSESAFSAKGGLTHN